MARLIFAVFILLNACNLKEGKTYVAKKLDGPATGSGPDWSKAVKLSNFNYPWRDEVPKATVFRAMWDDQRFYFRFDVEDGNILTYRDTDHKEEVVFSDRVEIFFKKNDRMSPYFCLEMDALGRVLDYEAHFYRKVNFDWTWPGRGLSVSSTKSGNKYVVDGSITLSSLKTLGVLRGNKMEAGLFRGECVDLEGKNADLRWISWVDPGTDTPDFHVPEAFGVIVLEP